MARVKRDVLANVTNGADDTYYYYYSAAGSDLTFLRGVISGGSGSVTVTLEGTFAEAADATAAAALAAGNWSDISTIVLGAANLTATFIKSCSNLIAPFSWVRVKVVANTGGADDGDWLIQAAKFTATADF